MCCIVFQVNVTGWVHPLFVDMAVVKMKVHVKVVLELGSPVHVYGVDVNTNVAAKVHEVSAILVICPKMTKFANFSIFQYIGI